MRKICKTLLILSIAGCATRGPLVEPCILSTSDADPGKWYGQCELKLPPDLTNPNNKSVQRKPRDMNKYICAPADDWKAMIEWAHAR